jgi:hypothetical protein
VRNLGLPTADVVCMHMACKKKQAGREATCLLLLEEEEVPSQGAQALDVLLQGVLSNFGILLLLEHQAVSQAVLHGPALCLADVLPALLTLHHRTASLYLSVYCAAWGKGMCPFVRR